MNTQNHPDIWWSERPLRIEHCARRSARSDANEVSAGHEIWIKTFFIVALIPMVGVCLKAAAGWGG